MGTRPSRPKLVKNKQRLLPVSVKPLHSVVRDISGILGELPLEELSLSGSGLPNDPDNVGLHVVPSV